MRQSQFLAVLAAITGVDRVLQVQRQVAPSISVAKLASARPIIFSHIILAELRKLPGICRGSVNSKKSKRRFKKNEKKNRFYKIWQKIVGIGSRGLGSYLIPAPAETKKLYPVSERVSGRALHRLLHAVPRRTLAGQRLLGEF